MINTSLADRQANRTDLHVVSIPGSDIAEELGDRRMTNMVLLGGLLANLPVLSMEALERALQTHLPVRHQRFLPLNIQSLRRGAGYVVAEVN